MDHPNNQDYSDLTQFGYYSNEYAISFTEFGQPAKIENSGINVLIRSIPISLVGSTLGSTAFDIVGLYPLVVPYDLQELAPDLMRYIGREYASFTAVLDPFNAFHRLPDQREFQLGGMLNFTRFKPHVVVDVSTGNPRQGYTKHHLDRVKKAKKKGVVVEYLEDLDFAAKHWYLLQSELNQQKGITGLKAMTKDMIEAQVKVKGLEVVAAYVDGQVAGISTWSVQRYNGFSHTTAMTDLGRKHLAGYAMYDFALHTLTDKYKDLHSISLGSYFSVPKIKYKTVNGLDYFKQGWSETGRMYSYLLTAILNGGLYCELCKASDTEGVKDYFPAYRNGELLHHGKE